MKYSVLFVLVHSMITVPNNINESKGKSSKVRSDDEDQYNNNEFSQDPSTKTFLGQFLKDGLELKKYESTLSQKQNSSFSILSNDKDQYNNEFPQNPSTKTFLGQFLKDGLKLKEYESTLSQKQNNSSSSSSNYIIAIIVLFIVGCLIGYLLYYYQDNKTDVPQEKSMENKG